jgi:hypothetical protein
VLKVGKFNNITITQAKLPDTHPEFQTMLAHLLSSPKSPKQTTSQGTALIGKKGLLRRNIFMLEIIWSHHVICSAVKECSLILFPDML